MHLPFRLSLQYFALILTVSLPFLNGCNQKYLLDDTDKSSHGQITVTSSNPDGTTFTLSDNLSLGLTTEDEDMWGYGLISTNSAYTLKDGQILPDDESTKIHLPDGLTSAKLYAYGPRVTGDNYKIDVKNNIVKIAHEVNLDQKTNGTSSSDLVWASTDYKGDNVKTSIELAHLYCKIKINISSELGKNLDDAEVTLLNVYPGGMLKLHDGKFTTSDIDADYAKDITAYRLGDGSFEAIIPPQKIKYTTYFIKVKSNGKEYLFENASEKTFIKGNEYKYNLKVKDAGNLPFTAQITYGGATMPNTLNIDALGVKKSIEMTEIPVTGAVSYTKLALRNANGSHCWAKIKNIDVVGRDDVIYSGVYSATMEIEENIGDERTMTLEFYNTKMPKFVHKSVVIKQKGAVDYLNLSSEIFNADKWGTVYDVPEELTISSNQKWTLKNIPNWVTVEGNTTDGLTQTLRITVAQNNTGSAREADLEFIVGETVKKTYKIKQSTTENKNFTLKYELNLHYNTTDNKFRAKREQIGTYYAGKVVIFAKYESNEDTAAEIETNNEYGYLVNTNKGFNEMVVEGFRSKYFIFPNYNGNAATISGINSSILSSSTQKSQNFFRKIIFDLPIPSGVKRNEMVKYTVTINGIKDSESHDKATVISEIISQ